MSNARGVETRWEALTDLLLGPHGERTEHPAAGSMVTSVPKGDAASTPCPRDTARARGRGADQEGPRRSCRATQVAGRATGVILRCAPPLIGVSKRPGAGQRPSC